MWRGETGKEIVQCEGVEGVRERERKKKKRLSPHIELCLPQKQVGLPQQQRSVAHC